MPFRHRKYIRWLQNSKFRTLRKQQHCAKSREFHVTGTISGPIHFHWSLSGQRWSSLPRDANTYPWVPLVRSISVMETSLPWSPLSLLLVVFLTFLVFFSVMVKLEWTSTSPIFEDNTHTLF